MALYRCLHSVGFSIALFNVTLDDRSNTAVKCGLALFESDLPALPITLRDIDTGRIICKLTPPEDCQNGFTSRWLSNPLDSLEFEVIPC
jgi:hypothetical protein